MLAAKTNCKDINRLNLLSNLNRKGASSRIQLRMFFISRPSAAAIDAFLESRKNDSYSYPDVGATRTPAPPAGYVVDHNRIKLGRGDMDFERAKQAIRQWKMFEVPGLELFYPDTPIEAGRDVALLAGHLGFYSLNACRVVYVIDERERFGFAYGTLSEHAESGEERFTVELDPGTGEIWYDIYAFSRPGHLLVKLGYPYSRYRQKAFSTGSKAAMLNAVLNIAGEAPPN
jgi:uncharacterized protein (UPF0548 family)